MKKMFLLILSLIVLGAVSVDAQVTIGSASDPHEGAVLDIQSTTQGLRLPTVAIADAKKFQLADEAKKATAVGMLVYNTNAGIIDGQGIGLYVWEGSQWLFAGLSGEVTGVAIASAGHVTGLNVGSTLQLTATVLPSYGTNKAVSWSVVSGTAATVDQNGLVSVAGDVSFGTHDVLVRATSDADATQYDEIVLTVTQPVGVTSVTGSQGIYEVYCYPNGLGCWMTDNSKEGVPVRKRFGFAADASTPETVYGTNPGASSGERGYYYEWANAAGACPSGYHLPNQAEWEAMQSYVNGSSASATEKDYWLSNSAHAGTFCDLCSLRWSGWDSHGVWWSFGCPFQYVEAGAYNIYDPTVEFEFSFTVRCVKSN